MKFTYGSDRFFENMMQETPNYNKHKYPRNKVRSNSAKFKYTFAHFDCKYCNSAGHCTYKLCPYIMRNLGDLLHDNDFITALENAEQCKNAQKTTLITLKERYREAFL